MATHFHTHYSGITMAASGDVTASTKLSTPAVQHTATHTNTAKLGGAYYQV